MERRERETPRLCPHCNDRPPAAHHPCPLDLEADGCDCCGACAKICSDIQNHIEPHTPHTFIDPSRGELEILYLEIDVPVEDDPLTYPTWEDPGDLGETA